MNIQNSYFFNKMLCICFLLLPLKSFAAEDLKILCSVKPVHGLVCMVKGDNTNVDYLIQDGICPHNYASKPSDIQKIKQANLIFFIDLEFESFLVKLLQTRAETKQIPLAKSSKIPLRTKRNSGHWESHLHTGETMQSCEHHDELDYHVWLNPDHAIAMIKTITKSLSDVDPANINRYKKNAIAAIEIIRATDATVRQKLEHVQSTSFIVFHDSYQYFENHYGLNAVGSIEADANIPFSAQRLTEIREKIKNLKVKVAFREPNLSDKLLDVLTSGQTVKIGVLDPLGADIPAGADFYPRLLNNLADTIARLMKP